MNRAYLAVLGTLALATLGCTGDFSTGGPPNTVVPTYTVDAGVDVADPLDNDAETAQALFEANVRGVIFASCSPGGACHSTQDPAFVAASPQQAYDTITIHKDRLYPGYNADGAKLLVNGAGGGHYGANFSAADIGAIEGWLSQEKQDAVGGPTTVSALAQWSGCMSLADWDAENVADLWANKPAGNQGNCEACHNLGADGFFASEQSARVFEIITTMPAFMPSYFTVDATGTNVLINRARLEGVGLQLAPHEGHGAFEVDGDAMAALQRFYDLTMQRKLQGQCGPPLF